MRVPSEMCRDGWNPAAACGKHASIEWASARTATRRHADQREARGSAAETGSTATMTGHGASAARPEWYRETQGGNDDARTAGTGLARRMEHAQPRAAHESLRRGCHVREPVSACEAPWIRWARQRQSGDSLAVSTRARELSESPVRGPRHHRADVRRDRDSSKARRLCGGAGLYG